MKHNRYKAKLIYSKWIINGKLLSNVEELNEILNKKKLRKSNEKPWTRTGKPHNHKGNKISEIISNTQTATVNGRKKKGKAKNDEDRNRELMNSVNSWKMSEIISKLEWYNIDVTTV